MSNFLRQSLGYFGGFLTLALGVMLASGGYSASGGGAFWPIIIAIVIAALASLVTVLGRGGARA